MTPEEAEVFYEEDEDPQKLFDRFGAGRQAAEMRDYIRGRYGDSDPGAPGWYEAGGVIANDPGPHGDSVPLPLRNGGCFPAGPQISASANLVRAHDGTWVTPDHLCPDLLRWESIGAADGLRGRVVRAFFWLLRAWPP